MNDHLEASSEEHLRKTWFKLLRTTERLNELKAVEGQIEELQTDKESMKMLLDGNSKEISNLKLTAKKLEVENVELKKDVAALQKQVEEVKLTAADDKEEVRSLKSEYKALKKEVEELRCSKAYPVQRVPEKLGKTMSDDCITVREDNDVCLTYHQPSEADPKREPSKNVQSLMNERYVKSNFFNKTVFNRLRIQFYDLVTVIFDLSTPSLSYK